MYIPVLHQEQRDSVIMFVSSSTCLTCTYQCYPRNRETLSSGLYCPPSVYHIHTCAAPGTERRCHRYCTVLHLFNMYIPVLHKEQRDAVIRFVPSSTCLTCTYLCCTRNRETLIKFLPSSTCLTCTYLCCTRIRETPSSSLYHPPPV